MGSALYEQKDAQAVEGGFKSFRAGYADSHIAPSLAENSSRILSTWHTYLTRVESFGTIFSSIAVIERLIAEKRTRLFAESWDVHLRLLYWTDSFWIDPLKIQKRIKPLCFPIQLIVDILFQTGLNIMNNWMNLIREYVVAKKKRGSLNIFSFLRKSSPSRRDFNTFYVINS